MTIKKLRELLMVFIEGKDRSISWAKSVETTIDNICEDSEETFEELQDYLASYRPGGGDYFFDENEMKKICLKVLKGLPN
jgi:propanediol dehydratase large subunit